MLFFIAVDDSATVVVFLGGRRDSLHRQALGIFVGEAGRSKRELFLKVMDNHFKSIH